MKAFPGVLNGGIIGSLLDCHCNWTAAWHIMKGLSLDKPLCTVTAHYSISLLRPTPSNSEVRLEAYIQDYDGRHKANVKGLYMLMIRLVQLVKAFLSQLRRVILLITVGDSFDL